ncbi:MAB_1171c family putative transporter [Streptomyces sp. NPDC051211]|uniref:MAB_1171c family putative transporter n=1 Tax=Streptomyces sp. NPDC051211 TaxID=3154643 RepID=UPI00344DD90D
MSDHSGYWILASAMWIACLIKAPGLRHQRGNPLYVTVCAVLLLGGIAYCCANPDVIGFVNEVTGVPNFSAPLVYSLLTAESAMILTLLVYWREGPEEKARRAARRWQAVYGLVVVAVIVLFAVGQAPVEQRTDFDTYYAGTPYIREMILLYLTAHTGAALMATVLCIRWFAGVTGPPWLRRGLRVLILGFALNFGMDFAKFAAIGARWAGRDWDVLNTRVAPLFAFACSLCTALGFVLPVVGGRVSGTVSAVRTFVRLGPLWRALRRAAPAVVPSLPVPWWEIDLRLTRRVAEVQDGRLALRPYRDAAVAEDASVRARAAGLSGEAAAAAVEAAVLAAAIAASMAASKAALDGAAADGSGEGDGDGSAELGDETAELPLLDREALVRVSCLFRHPPRAAGTGPRGPAAIRPTELEKPADGRINS